MFFLNLIKILSIFILIYFLYHMVKIFLRANKNLKNNAKNVRGNRKTGTDKNSSVIELDKDQYKVE